jgi:methionyl-tRNA formyltransferase
MKIIFFGTPDYVIPIMEALYKKFRTVNKKGVVAVVTQPPKPAGREKRLEYSAVDVWAYKHKIPIFHNYDDLPGADLGVVAAFGKIIPRATIEYFPKGILNVHASPTQAAISSGDTTTGVTVIKMDEKMDHGPVISKFTEKIEDTDTNEVLRRRLFERSSDLLVGLIPSYVSGKISLKEQNHEEATFTKLITKEDGFISQKALKEDPEGTERKFRAYQPWPGIYTIVKINAEEKRLKILDLHLGDEGLVFDQVQLEGKNPVSWEEFKKGYPTLSFQT